MAGTLTLLKTEEAEDFYGKRVTAYEIFETKAGIQVHIAIAKKIDRQGSFRIIFDRFLNDDRQVIIYNVREFDIREYTYLYLKMLEIAKPRELHEILQKMRVV